MKLRHERSGKVSTSSTRASSPLLEGEMALDRLLDLAYYELEHDPYRGMLAENSPWAYVRVFQKLTNLHRQQRCAKCLVLAIVRVRRWCIGPNKRMQNETSNETSANVTRISLRIIIYWANDPWMQTFPVLVILIQ